MIMIEPVQALTDLSQHRLNICMYLIMLLCGNLTCFSTEVNYQVHL